MNEKKYYIEDLIKGKYAVNTRSQKGFDSVVERLVFDLNSSYYNFYKKDTCIKLDTGSYGSTGNVSEIGYKIIRIHEINWEKKFNNIKDQADKILGKKETIDESMNSQEKVIRHHEQLLELDGKNIVFDFQGKETKGKIFIITSKVDGRFSRVGEKTIYCQTNIDGVKKNCYLSKDNILLLEDSHYDYKTHIFKNIRLDENKKYTIEEIKENKIAVRCNGKKEMDKLIGKKSFPDETKDDISVNWFYENNRWVWSNDYNLPKHFKIINFEDIDFSDEEKSVEKKVIYNDYMKIIDVCCDGDLEEGEKTDKIIDICNRNEVVKSNQSEKQQIEQQLRDLADELNGDEKIDWEDREQWKYQISYFTKEKYLSYKSDILVKTIGGIYCIDKDFLEKAIERIGETNLLKLFDIETPEKEYTMAEAIKEGLDFEYGNVKYKVDYDMRGALYGFKPNTVGYLGVSTVWILEHQNEIVTIIGGE